MDDSKGLLSVCLPSQAIALAIREVEKTMEAAKIKKRGTIRHPFAQWHWLICYPLFVDIALKTEQILVGMHVCMDHQLLPLICIESLGAK